MNKDPNRDVRVFCFKGIQVYQTTKFLLFLGEITPYAQIPPKPH